MIRNKKPTKKWVNYGDADPREHGGRFLRWNNDHWELVITTDMKDHGMLEDDPERYMFEEYYFEPDQVWVDGDPSKGFTDNMQAAADELNREIDPTDIQDVEWVLPDLAFHTRAKGYDTYAKNYWKHLKENWGIRPKHA